MISAIISALFFIFSFGYAIWTTYKILQERNRLRDEVKLRAEEVKELSRIAKLEKSRSIAASDTFRSTLNLMNEFGCFNKEKTEEWIKIRSEHLNKVTKENDVFDVRVSEFDALQITGETLDKDK